MSISFFKNSVLRPKSLLLRKQLFTLFSIPQRNTKPLKQGLQKNNLFCTGIQQNTELFDVFSKKYKQRGSESISPKSNQIPTNTDLWFFIFPLHLTLLTKKRPTIDTPKIDSKRYVPNSNNGILQ